MKLNKLSYRLLDDDYLCIELLIDGNPIEGLAEADNKAIPFYDFETNELPHYYNEFEGAELYILGVCSCGVEGCGNAVCEITQEKDCVVFQNFRYGHSLPKGTEFRFTHENYDSVMREIFEDVENYKLTTGRVNKYK